MVNFFIDVSSGDGVAARETKWRGKRKRHACRAALTQKLDVLSEDKFEGADPHRTVFAADIAQR
jgi:hypothetical protein